MKTWNKTIFSKRNIVLTYRDIKQDMLLKFRFSPLTNLLLDKYLKLQNTTNEQEQKNLVPEFLRDVKARIKEIQSRD